MVKTKTSVMIEDDVWREAKKEAIDLGIDVSEYLEKALKEFKKEKKK